MAELSFVVRGKVVNASALLKTEKPKAVRKVSEVVKVDDRSNAKWSLGFVVAGFTQDRIDKAEADAKALRQAAIDHNKDVLSGRLKSEAQKKVPPEWSRERFLREAKPTRVRSKPYEMREAALQCADMARKVGWINVTVTEEIRG